MKLTELRKLCQTSQDTHCEIFVNAKDNIFKIVKGNEIFFTKYNSAKIDKICQALESDTKYQNVKSLATIIMSKCANSNYKFENGVLNHVCWHNDRVILNKVMDTQYKPNFDMSNFEKVEITDIITKKEEKAEKLDLNSILNG